MQTEKFNINLAPGMERVEVIMREGTAPELLKETPPVQIKLNGTIGSVTEFLTKRINTGQFEQKDCHILVDREDVSITLIINETDAYKRSCIRGVLDYNPKFIEFGINTNHKWTPTELGIFFKMNRAYFPDRESNMDLVTTLMNFTATVNSNIERSVSENGNRTDNYAQVVNSNLPQAFNLYMPIFKGMPAEIFEVETFASLNGREVTFLLISPGAQSALEELRNKVIDEEVKKIREVAPDIVIIEV